MKKGRLGLPFFCRMRFMHRSNKYLLIGFTLLTLAACQTRPMRNTMPPGNTISSSSPTSSSSSLHTPPSSSTAVSTNPNAATVLRNVDGDTLEVNLADGTKAKVRILGIDTPETVDPRKTVQCFGQEASARMKELVQGKTITLVKDPAQDKDVYGRLLRYIDLNGVDIGAEMIAEGYAYSYKKYPQPRLEEYNKLEVQARNAGKGLWGSCPL